MKTILQNISFRYGTYRKAFCFYADLVQDDLGFYILTKVTETTETVDQRLHAIYSESDHRLMFTIKGIQLMRIMDCILSPSIPIHDIQFNRTV